jgi:pimeloyl-ACP methyl ester carboxylesterase
MQHVLPKIPRPSLLHMFSEGRSLIELSAFGAALPFLKRAPCGDGHPVMVLPGFLASDFSTKPIRSFLKGKGYETYGWELGRNLGTDIVGGEQVLSDKLINRVIEISVIHNAKVSLVGWSLGGILARELARIIPDCVRQVITLGSPFNGSQGSSPVVEGLFELINGNVSESNPDVVQQMFTPPPVPNSALYSKSDGVVHWQACINHRIKAHHQAENIQVCGSHSGLGHNPHVVWIVANRLSQPEASWQPYKLEKTQFSGKLKLV